MGEFRPSDSTTMCFISIRRKSIAIFKYCYRPLPSMKAKHKRLHLKASVLRALADPIRLDMIELLRKGERCVCEITPYVKVTQPLVSRHLKILKERGIIKSRKERNRRYYSITDDRILNMLDSLDQGLLISLSNAAAQHSNIPTLREILA